MPDTPLMIDCNVSCKLNNVIKKYPYPNLNIKFPLCKAVAAPQQQLAQSQWPRRAEGYF